MGNYMGESVHRQALYFRGKEHLVGCIKYDNSPNGRLEQEERSFSVILPFIFKRAG